METSGSCEGVMLIFSHVLNVDRDIGATVLVDDNPRYATECAAAGIDVLLYDWNHGYPWSKTSDG